MQNELFLKTICNLNSFGIKSLIKHNLTRSDDLILIFE